MQGPNREASRFDDRGGELMDSPSRPGRAKRPTDYMYPMRCVVYSASWR